MSIKVGKGGAVSESDIAALEEFLGTGLPAGLKSFLAEHDGAQPETNIFRINDTNDSGVNRFIPTRQFLSEREKIDDLSPRAFPIAWAEGGNYVIIDVEDGESVYFWDHETAELTKLSDAFSGFLNLLQPFNVDDIELKPGQVKSVWVDPDLLKEFGDG